MPETDSIYFALHFWSFLDVFFFIFERSEYIICILLAVSASVYNYLCLRLVHCCVVEGQWVILAINVAVT